MAPRCRECRTKISGSSLSARDDGIRSAAAAFDRPLFLSRFAYYVYLRDYYAAGIRVLYTRFRFYTSQRDVRNWAQNLRIYVYTIKRSIKMVIAVVFWANLSNSRTYLQRGVYTRNRPFPARLLSHSFLIVFAARELAL